MYHEIAQPFAFLYNLVPALKPGARVGIVDLDRPIGEHGTRPDLLRCELAAVGYEEVSFTKLTGDIGYLDAAGRGGAHAAWSDQGLPGPERLRGVYETAW
jgi:hypothetical protein